MLLVQNLRLVRDDAWCIILPLSVSGSLTSKKKCVPKSETARVSMRRRSPGCARPSRRDDGDSCICGLYDIISHYKSTILFIFFIGLLGCCCSTKIKTGEASGDRSFPIRILISMLNLCACAVGFGVRLIVSILFCIGKNLPALCSECLTMAKDKHKSTENQLPIKSDLPDIENKKATKMMYERNEHLPRNQTLENDYNTSLPLLEYTAYCSNDTGEVERKHQEIISLLKKHSCYCERTDTMAKPKNQIATSDDCDMSTPPEADAAPASPATPAAPAPAAPTGTPGKLTPALPRIVPRIMPECPCPPPDPNCVPTKPCCDCPQNSFWGPKRK
ncbi:unnamed protein product [Plutella xylostella]|uniref:(diamondback moth) hypothetical protein n=1 Tax=Plutella xylostella TaxID=51655 RepID=A0A8S4F1F0_PLUXY|nr:unnamed protein product [Plutella xylostella]